MKTIRLKNMKIYAYHGVNNHEKKFGAEFQIDIELTYNNNKSFISDKLKDVINYEEVYDSLPSEQIVIKVLNDTIYNSIYNESLVLKPILDITGKSELIVPLDIDPEGKELVGWGYWVSLNPFNTIDWFSNKDNDLINFAKQEFFNSDEKINSFLNIPQ